ncbi:hypothetical protein DQ04_03281080 [Trypanosoma grayi]|uniref:hypothetical protein n=1 Tax=Trypanosoma grayi TaxID=71804 RepID=UPI0004F43FB2|nr:hypothetical protein DQ04_03281080 [Trypanosoma grayi]KEG10805.1 hypothetical protein DQ04_03281080 [Trypanosoma grayi]
MREPLVTCRSVERVLNALQRKHHWLADDARAFFIAGRWERDVRAWINTHQRGDGCAGRRQTRPNARAKLPGNWMVLDDDLASKKEFLKAAVGNQQHDGPPSASFCVFADEKDRREATQARYVGDNVTMLPFTTVEAALYIRSRGRRSNDAKTCTLLPHSVSAENVLLDDTARSSTSLNDCCAIFLNRHSADLVAVDFAEGETSDASLERPTTAVDARQGALNAVTLGVHLLKPSGAVLLRFSSHANPGGNVPLRALLRHMRWSFQVSACEVDSEHVYCVGCRSITEHPIAELPRDCFPGFFPRSKPRPKRWNPRSETKQPFFAALMPSFTNAPLVKEPLSRALAEEMEAAKKSEEKADSLFGVSVEMVEKGLHHYKQDD